LPELDRRLRAPGARAPDPAPLASPSAPQPTGRGSALPPRRGLAVVQRPRADWRLPAPRRLPPRDGRRRYAPRRRESGVRRAQDRQWLASRLLSDLPLDGDARGSLPRSRRRTFERSGADLPPIAPGRARQRRAARPDRQPAQRRGPAGPRPPPALVLAACQPARPGPPECQSRPLLPAPP